MMDSEIKKYFGVYLMLLALLTLTVVASVQPLSPWVSTSFSLGIAVAKAALVLIFFMKLKNVSSKIRFFAFGTLLWTFILITLISTDYLTRGLSGVLGK